MIQDTSIEAYHSLYSGRQAQQGMVLSIIEQARRPSSSDIARLTGIPRTSVCGRLRELEMQGKIEKGDKKKDPWTNMMVYWYRIKKEDSA